MNSTSISQDSGVKNFGQILASIDWAFLATHPELHDAAVWLKATKTAIVNFPLRHAARDAGVSPGVFTALATALGFDSYEDMRIYAISCNANAAEASALIMTRLGNALGFTFPQQSNQTAVLR